MTLWRCVSPIHDAAGFETMLCGVQDELFVDVEERQPGRDPLQQLHRKEQQRRTSRTLHFLQRSAQQWRGEAGRFVCVSSCAFYIWNMSQRLRVYLNDDWVNRLVQF